MTYMTEDVQALGGGVHMVAAGPCEPVADVLRRLTASLGAALTGIAVLRRSHASETEPVPSCSNTVKLCVEHKVAVLDADTVQLLALSSVVDEYAVTADGGLASVAQAAPLPAFLYQRGFVLQVSRNVQSVVVKSAAAQSSCTVMMIAPAAFQSNAQAAQDNAFMAPLSCLLGERAAEVTPSALTEHSELVAALTAAGVRVHVFSHTLAHGTPDAVFPNNWFMSAADGTLTLCPMRNPNRQAERRPDIVQWLHSRPGCKRLLDFTDGEKQIPPRIVEGTGSLVFDHVNSVAYMARSERSHEGLAREMSAALGFKQLVAFDAIDRGNAIYHTNVLLAIGTSVAVVCADAIPEEQRGGVMQALCAGGSREVVTITRDQMGAFCGNILEVRSARDGLPMMAMSTGAFNRFTEQQRAALLGHVSRLVHVQLDTIEYVGGGGVRCCIGELFH
jgi:hypothetical protein